MLWLILLPGTTIPAVYGAIKAIYNYKTAKLKYGQGQ